MSKKKKLRRFDFEVPYGGRMGRSWFTYCYAGTKSAAIFMMEGAHKVAYFLGEVKS